MKKSILLCLLLLPALIVSAGEGSGHFHKSFRDRYVPVEHIEQQFSKWFALPAGTEWVEVSRNTDDIGMTRIEYRQFLLGIEVEHSQILIHAKDGRVLTANGTVMEENTSPARTRIVHRAPASQRPTAAGEELLLVDTPEGYRYANKKLSPAGEWEYRDIETGELLKRVPTSWNFSDTGTPATLKCTGIYCGEVDIDVAKMANGSYTLYDAGRNIYTINAAYIKSLQQLAEENKLEDYFPQELIPKEKTFKDLSSLKSSLRQKKPDLTKYLLSAGTMSSTDGQFYTFQLKDMTVERLLAADENQTVYDMMPSEKRPVLLWLRMRYADTDGSLADMLILRDEPSSTISLGELTETCRLLPREGVTFIITVIKPKVDIEGDLFEEGEVESFAREYTINFVPDESGLTVVDREDIKVTFNYERAGNPAVDAHYNIGCALDYYQKVHGRNSYDGNNSPVYNVVYQPTTDDLYALSPLSPQMVIEGKPNDDFADPDEPPLYVFEITNLNAAAVNDYNPYYMIYGIGGRIKDTYMLPMVEKSVTFHEFTHLVTATSAQLEYQNESGALNEAFSDVMAISIMKSPIYGQGPETPWVIGSHLSRYSSLRNMADPKQSMDGLRPGPDTYEGEYWIDWKTDDNDHGGVHTNSSVMNKFYYLLCDGGSGTNDLGFTYNLTGIGVEKAEKIAFRTLVQYATRQSDYSDIRKCFVEAATDLYGSTEVEAVKNAWDAVNVKDAGDITDAVTQITSFSDGSQSSSIYDLQGRRVVTPAKGIYVINGRKMIVR